MAAGIVMPKKYRDGDWEDYILQFNLVCDLNEWDEQKRALVLGISLEGSALSKYKELPMDVRKNFKQLSTTLGKALSPVENIQIEKLKFTSRKRQSGESFADMASAIRQQASRAYPFLNGDAHDELAQEKFLAALPDEIRLLVRQRMPSTLGEAVSVAMQQEAALEVERVEVGVSGRKHLVNAVLPQQSLEEILKENSAAMRLMVEALKNLDLNSNKSRRSDRGRGRCFKCNEYGHFQANCPEVKNQGNAQGSM